MSNMYVSKKELEDLKLRLGEIENKLEQLRLTMISYQDAGL